MNKPPSTWKGRDPFAWYELNWPADLDSKQVTAWLHSLSGHNGSRGSRFIAIATTGKIRHYIVFPSKTARSHIRSLKTFIGDIELKNIDPMVIDTQLSAKAIMTSRHRVMNVHEPEMVAHSLISSLSVLAPGEQLVLVWVLGKRFSPQAIPNGTMSTYSSNWLIAVPEAFMKQPQPLDQQALTSLRNKKDYPSWKANLYIGVKAETKHRQIALIERVGGALRAADAPGVRMGVRLSARSLRVARTPWLWPLNINVEEFTGLLSWPLGDQKLPGISRIKSRYLPIPREMQNNGRTIAHARNGTTRLGLSAQDAMLHTHVIGPTGVGKSTLLLNLITQDMASGHAVIVVDPKGDLINDVLARVPESRKNDVIVLDPSDNTSPVGLNPIARNNQSSSLTADNILSIFKGLYGTNFGPRSQDILHAGLLTLSSTPGMSLSSLPILYTNEDFRNSLLKNINDPLGLNGFWDWYNKISPAERNAVIAPVMNKVRAFLLRPSMRRVICQSEPKLDIQEVLTDRKILLVNLAKGILGSETSQLFGSIVVSQVWQAIQARANLPISKRTPGFVYIDEVQDYMHLPTDIGDVLAQSRSYGIGMILAHQHLAQLPTDLRAGILANVRSKVCFQLGHADAVEMAKSSTILTPTDFENLDRYNIYAKLVANGATQPWVSGVTLGPPDKLSSLDEVRRISRQNYGVPVSEIDSSFTKLIAANSPEADTGGIINLIESEVL